MPPDEGAVGGFSGPLKEGEAIRPGVTTEFIPGSHPTRALENLTLALMPLLSAVPNLAVG